MNRKEFLINTSRAQREIIKYDFLLIRNNLRLAKIGKEIVALVPVSSVVKKVATTKTGKRSLKILAVAGIFLKIISMWRNR